MNDYNPAFLPCMSHTLCTPGEAFNAPDAEAIQKSYNLSIMHHVKSFSLMRILYSVTPNFSGGVYWWNKWEHNDQLN